MLRGSCWDPVKVHSCPAAGDGFPAAIFRRHGGEAKITLLIRSRCEGGERGVANINNLTVFRPIPACAPMWAINHELFSSRTPDSEMMADIRNAE